MPPGPLRVLGGYPVLARPEVLAWLRLTWLRLTWLRLIRLQVTRLQVVARLRMLADAGALAHPDRARAEDAAQLASARQVDPVT
jgi:hypothetical protein